MVTGWQQLADVVAEAQEGGTYVPCRARDMRESAKWLSEVDSEQQKAADACYSCPLMTQCGTAATQIPLTEIWGVLGGYTVRERIEMDRQRSQKKKEAS